MHFAIHTMNSIPKARMTIIKIPILQNIKRIIIDPNPECKQKESCMSTRISKTTFNQFNSTHSKWSTQEKQHQVYTYIYIYIITTTMITYLPSSLSDQHTWIPEQRIKAKKHENPNPNGFHLSPIAWPTFLFHTGRGSDYFRWKPRRCTMYYTKSPGFSSFFLSFFSDFNVYPFLLLLLLLLLRPLFSSKPVTIYKKYKKST